ncbi:MAG: hypothetical protein WC497_05615 [Patescibacteria group bacterium]
MFILILVGSRVARADWGAPTAAPPTGNTAAPVNVSGVTQTKQGSLKIGGEFLSVDSGDLVVSAGDIFLPSLTTGLYWSAISNPPDNAIAHINYDSSQTLFISLGNTGDHIELQGPVKVSKAGGNNGSLTIDNDGALHYLSAESTKIQIVNNSFLPASHIGELSVADSAAGVDLKSYASPLYLNADTGTNVNVGSKIQPSKLCLNDQGDGLECIDNWDIISGGGVSGTARYIPKFNDTGDGLIDSIMIETDTLGFKAVGIGDPNPTNARLSVGLTDNNRASIQLDATASPDGGYAWNLHSTAFAHAYGAGKFVIEAQGAYAEKSVVINHIGQTGLGTDYPTARLNVKGRTEGGSGDDGTVSIDVENLQRVYHCATCGATTFTYFGPGDMFVLESTPAVSRTIERVTDDNELIVTQPFPASANGLSFHIIPSIARFSDASADPNTASKFLIDPNGNVRLSTLPNCTGDQTLDTDEYGNIICGVDAGAVGGDNYTVKVSENDTTDNYLGTKLVAGSNISLTVVGGGGNESLQIDAAGLTSLWKTGATANTISPVNEATDKVAIGHNTIPDSTQLSVKNNSVNSTIYIEQSNTDGFAGYLSGKTVVMNGNVGIGDASPLSLLTVGTADQFRVDSSGNLIRINDLQYSWPIAQGTIGSVLTNNGSGGLSWSSVASASFWETGASVNTINPIDEATDKVAIGHNDINDSTRLSVKANSLNVAVYGEQSDANGWAGYFSGKTLLSFSDTVNDTKDVVQIQRALTSGVGAAGLGGSILFSLVDSAGTSNPAARLDAVWEDATNDSEDASLRFNTAVNGAMTEAMRIDDAGNVGIGLSNPTGALNLYRTNAAILRIQNGVTGTASGDGLELSIGNNEAYLWNYENAEVYIGTNDTERLTILGNGNIGIGNTAPASLLTVSSSISPYNGNHTIAGYNNSTTSYNALAGYKSGVLALGSGVYGELVNGLTCGLGTCAGIYGSDGSGGTNKWAGYFDGPVKVTGGLTLPIATVTANRTLTNDDYTILADSTLVPITISLPQASTATGRIYVIKHAAGANTVTVDGYLLEAIDGAKTLTLALQQSAIIQSNGSNWFIL